MTVVVCIAELLPELESAVPELTEAVFEIVELFVTEVLTRTTRVKTAEPTAKLGFVQLIAPVPPTAGCVGQVHRGFTANGNPAFAHQRASGIPRLGLCGYRGSGPHGA